MDLASAIATLEGLLGDPRRGVPDDVFLLVSRLTPIVNVDLLVQGDRGTLLTWRDDEFFGRGWHLPGGVIRFKEPATDRIHACALDELGTDVCHEPEPLLVLESVREQQTRGHLVSLLYRCALVGELDVRRRADDAAPAPGQWRWHSRCPPDLLPVHAPYAKFF